tara:strand:- start:9731 stop:11560 length:1830 start_codon:yes stop_codon:yes gene_type:complete
MTNGTPETNTQTTLMQRLDALLSSPALWVFLIAITASLYIGRYVSPTWTVKEITLDAKKVNGVLTYTYKGKPKPLTKLVAYASSPLHPARITALNAKGQAPTLKTQFYYKDITLPQKGAKKQPTSVKKRVYGQFKVYRHWGFWSLIPALVALLLCWVTREPLPSLFGGVLAGAFLLGSYDITDQVLLPSLMSKQTAGVLLLYLWLLGGLLGVWSKTGAARAFAELMTKYFVKGPRSAKVVAWVLGVIFFQGGTVSTVLVGTTVKPLADEHKISHEELSYIVDSTASPIASQLAFNAWPGYIQSFIFVAGVSFLATEADRIAFFFKSVPFCFYAIFAVLGTFLLAIEKSPYTNKELQTAIDRARNTGALDAPDATPLSAKELEVSDIPEGYTPHIIDFFAPLFTLIGIAIGTFIATGSPNVRWAFGAALALAMLLALARGMSLQHLMDGFGNGMKGVLLGAVILVFAITLGNISKMTGGGVYLVELLGTSIPYWMLPVLLQLLTMVIAFSTGTSWGTYAVAFPLAMPLAWAVAGANGLAHPEFYMTICFAAVMDGSVYGDQCSPISDTTVLSAMCSGCDLMDHVRTQLPQATVAAGLAAVCWTGCVYFFA